MNYSEQIMPDADDGTRHSDKSDIFEQPSGNSTSDLQQFISNYRAAEAEPPKEPLETSELESSIERPALLEEEESEDGSQLGAIIYEVLETVLLAVIIWLLVNFTTARYVVEGQSMEPNLHTGQFLIVSRLAYMQVGDTIQLGEPERGDIVVFDFPGNPGDDYVKRVVGLPGETVTIDEDGRVVVDGYQISEPYLSPPEEQPYRGRHGTWTVPEDSYFVIGDNRNSSSDSRSWGMLSDRFIVGKAWLSYWPPRHWGVIPHYEYSSPEATLSWQPI